jgi:hypothetical protein
MPSQNLLIFEVLNKRIGQRMSNDRDLLKTLTFAQSLHQAQILILEILRVFLTVPMVIGRVIIIAFLDLE